MGEITGTIDVAQVTLYVFWAFFAALVFWLRREDRREGYPLESDPAGKVSKAGSFMLPRPKTFRLRDGTTYSAPHDRRDTRPVAAVRAAAWPGAPLIPTGDPLVDGVGPAAWAMRRDVPDKTWDGQDKIVPLGSDPHYVVESDDPDPRGLPVIAADRRVAGRVADLWVDRAEHVVRYLEVDTGTPGVGALLVPINLAKVSRSAVTVKSVTSAQFANVPRAKTANSVTFLEEDRICAYFAGGHLYALPGRTEAQL